MNARRFFSLSQPHIFRMVDNKNGVTNLYGPIKLVNVNDRSIDELVMIEGEYSDNHTVVYLQNFTSAKLKHRACAGILRNVQKKNARLQDIIRMNFMTIETRYSLLYIC